MRHNDVKDTTAQTLKEIGHDVTLEALLLPLQGELRTRLSEGFERCLSEC